MAVRIVMDEGGMAQLEARIGAVVGRVLNDVEDDARRYVAVDTGDLRSTIRTEHDGRALAGRVWCGNRAAGIDYWATVEYGSRPHIIRSHGPWPLRNRETGQVFGRVVHHPGTPEQPFMRPALYRARLYGDMA
jgi:hypothetical protein